ncbi:hypothetical protein D9M69_595800 [compost metagenome]
MFHKAFKAVDFCGTVSAIQVKNLLFPGSGGLNFKFLYLLKVIFHFLVLPGGDPSCKKSAYILVKAPKPGRKEGVTSRVSESRNEVKISIGFERIRKTYRFAYQKKEAVLCGIVLHLVSKVFPDGQRASFSVVELIVNVLDLHQVCTVAPTGRGCTVGFVFFCRFSQAGVRNDHIIGGDRRKPESDRAAFPEGKCLPG